MIFSQKAYLMPINQSQRSNKLWLQQDVLLAIALALIYFISGKASLSFSVSHEIATLVVFAAKGFALAGTILYGKNISYGIFIGQLLLALSNGLSLPIALGISISNTLEAILGYKLFYKLNLHPNLERIKDVVWLHLIVFLILQPFSATIGTAIFGAGGILNGAKYGNVWLTWWFGNSLGQILITPLVLSIFSSFSSTKQNLPTISQKHKTNKTIAIAQAGMTLTGVFTVGWLTFYLPGFNNTLLVLAIIMPLIIASAIWQAMPIVTLSVLLITAISLQATGELIGPFAVNGTTNLLELSIFLLGITLTAQYVAVFSAKLKQAQAQLQLSTSVFKSAHDGIIILNSAGIIIDVNPAFEQMINRKRESIIGLDLTDILIEKRDRTLSNEDWSREHPTAKLANRQSRLSRNFHQTLWKTVEDMSFWQGEIAIVNQSGTVIPNLLTLSMVSNSHNEVVCYTAFFTNITNLKHKQSKYKQLALFDRLTGLPNRRLLSKRLQKEIKLSKKNKKMIGVCYIDLDGFKQVNDTLGHEAGDKLLIAITERFQNCLRRVDTLARIGGDEFVMVLSRVESVQQCQEIVQRVIDTASVPIYIDNETANVSASVGVTVYPQDKSDHKTLLRHADAAMYLAKAIGKGRYCLFDPETEIIYRQSHQ